jgi:hypothetical protein
LLCFASVYICIGKEKRISFRNIHTSLLRIVFGKYGNNDKSKFARNEEGRGLCACFYRRGIRRVVRDARCHEHDVRRQTGR